MKTEEYIVCYLSEIGHNNFWYPTEQKALVLKSLIIDFPALVGGGDNLVSAIININDILPLTTSASYIKNNYRSDNVIIWIDKP